MLLPRCHLDPRGLAADRLLPTVSVPAGSGWGGGYFSSLLFPLLSPF